MNENVRGDGEGGLHSKKTPKKKHILPRGVSLKTTPKRILKNTTPKKKPQTPEFRQVLKRIKEKRRLKDLEARQEKGEGGMLKL